MTEERPGRAPEATLAHALEARLRAPPRATLTIALFATFCSTIALAPWSDAPTALHRLLALGVVPSKIAEGQLWRSVTGTWLHDSWSHLAINMIALVYAGRLVEAVYGSSGMWLLYATSAACGVLGSCLSGVTVSVGASGAIFGLIGALLSAGMRLYPRLPTRERRLLLWLPALAIGSVLVVEWMGRNATARDVDVGAHSFGALGGGMLGHALLSSTSMALDGQMNAQRLRSSGALTAGVSLVALMCHVWAFAAALPRATDDLKIASANVRHVEVDGASIAIPDGYEHGVWRDGKCDGTMVPIQWALKTQRIPCFNLPLGGWLLVGRRDRLLTMDEGDDDAMRKANAERRFVRRQAGITLYPVADHWLYVIVAAEALHTPYNDALDNLLRAAGTATIKAPTTPQPVMKNPASQT